MARKAQLAVQQDLDTNQDYLDFMRDNKEKIICMEIYCGVFGACAAMVNTLKKIKFEIAQDYMEFGKALADEIEDFERFRGRSEPVYMFITKGMTTGIMFGANAVRLVEMAKREVDLFKAEGEGRAHPRPRVNISEMHPLEVEKMEILAMIQEQKLEEARAHEEMVQDSRKRRINTRLASNPDIMSLNFVLFWPNCHRAHYDLYDRWGTLNLTIAYKDIIQLEESMIKEIFYMGDVDLNDACVYTILKGPVLALLLRKMDTDTRDFINLLRNELYELILEPIDAPANAPPPTLSAFRYYSQISKTKRAVRRERYEAKLEQKRIAKEEMDRLKAEEERLAREAEEERQREEKQRADEEKLKLLQMGGGAATASAAAAAPTEPKDAEAVGEEQIVEEGEDNEEEEDDNLSDFLLDDDFKLDDDVVMEAEKLIEEEEEEEEEEFNSQISIEGEEYIPPGGLFVPGLYTPPNELSKANAIAVLFPTFISRFAQIESEFLPPHVLMTFPVEKRHEVMEVAASYPDEIIAKGIFAGDAPYDAEHVAFTAKQYDKLPARVPQPIIKENTMLGILYNNESCYKIYEEKCKKRKLQER